MLLSAAPGFPPWDPSDAALPPVPCPGSHANILRAHRFDSIGISNLFMFGRTHTFCRYEQFDSIRILSKITNPTKAGVLRQPRRTAASRDCTKDVPSPRCAVGVGSDAGGGAKRRPLRAASRTHSVCRRKMTAESKRNSGLAGAGSRRRGSAQYTATPHAKNPRD